MDFEWREEDHDPVSGRKIFGAEDEVLGKSKFKYYNSTWAKQYEVQNAQGAVLLKAFGDVDVELGFKLTLTFVEGSEGTRVRLFQSGKAEIFYDVPDEPSDPPPVLQHMT